MSGLGAGGARGAPGGGNGIRNGNGRRDAGVSRGGNSIEGGLNTPGSGGEFGEFGRGDGHRTTGVPAGPGTGGRASAGRSSPDGSGDSGDSGSDSGGGDRGRGRVLVVDDDAAIRRSLRRGLRLNGFAVELAEGGRRALSLMREQPADVVVLDISMPDVDGIQVCQAIRDDGDDVPVLMLSALDETADRIAGLQAGGDDYLVKPFALQELVLRLEALLRRRTPPYPAPAASAPNASAPNASAATAPAPGHTPEPAPGAAEAIRVSGLVINPATREAHRDGEPLPLTRREFELLLVLARNAGIVLTRDQLLERVWGYDFEVRTDAVDTFISYLRRKTESGGRPRLLHTVRGVGFVLREEK
jgi:DNA-binding response OmpR family regulator